MMDFFKEVKVETTIYKIVNSKSFRNLVIIAGIIAIIMHIFVLSFESINEQSFEDYHKNEYKSLENEIKNIKRIREEKGVSDKEIYMIMDVIKSLKKVSDIEEVAWENNYFYLVLNIKEITKFEAASSLLKKSGFQVEEYFKTDEGYILRALRGDNNHDKDG